MGEVNFRVEHTNYTNLRSRAGFFLLFRQSVTVSENLHNWLHFPSFLCVFALAKRSCTDHNQDPRGIDW
ncbi:hypothetical protein C2U53_14570 [Citrobacter sp. CFNIH10]|nr:hypothetical protein C2U53_14570 [Citrobacter sp. CFNIH10]AVC45359.1 hypothetical protein AL524_24605 [Citrobacter amalonaticus]PNP36804.1 hypothetical protein AL525_004120 [Citrobacter amalonaticus]